MSTQGSTSTGSTGLSELELDLHRFNELELIQHGWPPALAKAAVDQFSYALGLKNGLRINFTSAEPVSINGVLTDWVHLEGDGLEVHLRIPISPDDGPYSYDRGIDVRISEIAWAVDAPYGS